SPPSSRPCADRFRESFGSHEGGGEGMGTPGTGTVAWENPDGTTDGRRAVDGAGSIPAIEVHDLTVAYHRRPVLWAVDVEMPKGALIGLIGPNGAGKSTLLKAILDMVPKASGWVKIEGKPYREQRR